MYSVVLPKLEPLFAMWPSCVFLWGMAGPVQRVSVDLFGELHNYQITVVIMFSFEGLLIV